MIIDVKKANNNIKDLISKGKWLEVCQQPFISEDFIRKNVENMRWYALFSSQKFDSNFIEEMYPNFSKRKDKYDIFNVISDKQNLTEEFIDKHISEVNLCSIAAKQKISGDFFQKHINKFCPQANKWLSSYKVSEHQVYNMPPCYFLDEDFYTFENVKRFRKEIFLISTYKNWKTDEWFYEFENDLKFFKTTGNWSYLLNYCPTDIFKRNKNNIEMRDMLEWMWKKESFSDKQFALLSLVIEEIKNRKEEEAKIKCQQYIFDITEIFNVSKLSIDQIKSWLNILKPEMFDRKDIKKKELKKIKEVFEQYKELIV
jgi:hypothetical protein